jgi:hypothetical protein
MVLLLALATGAAALYTRTHRTPGSAAGWTTGQAQIGQMLFTPPEDWQAQETPGGGIGLVFAEPGGRRRVLVVTVIRPAPRLNIEALLKRWTGDEADLQWGPQRTADVAGVPGLRLDGAGAGAPGSIGHVAAELLLPDHGRCYVICLADRSSGGPDSPGVMDDDNSVLDEVLGSVSFVPAAGKPGK